MVDGNNIILFIIGLIFKVGDKFRLSFGGGVLNWIKFVFGVF